MTDPTDGHFDPPTENKIDISGFFNIFPAAPWKVLLPFISKFTKWIFKNDNTFCFFIIMFPT